MKIETQVDSLRGAFKNALKLSASEMIFGQFVRITNGEMYATDLDTWSISNFPSTGRGDMLLPYKQTIRALRGESGPLSIELIPKPTPKGNPHVELTIGDTKFALDSKSVTEFPVCPPAGKHTTTVNGNDFRQIIDRAAIAMSTEESRYSLNGALLRVHNCVADLIATDGHRLSIATAPAKGENLQTLLRAGALQWLKKNIGEDVAVGTDGEWTSFRTDSLILITRPLAGTFPQYADVIPKHENTSVHFPSAPDLEKSLARAAKFADSGKATKWTFEGHDYRPCTISAGSFDTGSANTLVSCIVKGDAVEIGWNADYVLDMLKAAGDVPVQLGIDSPRSASIFTVGNNWKYILMPMRI